MKSMIALAALSLVAAPVLADALLAVPAGDTVYYVSDFPGVYEESNGFEGLQELADDHDEDGKIDPPDTRVA